MQVNYSDQSVMKGDVSLFLAGPTPRSIDVLTWRKEAVQILGELGFEGIVYVPEKEFDDRTFDYDNQVWWEREALYNASVIVFWVPRNSKTMPAFTTNVEFGYWLAKNSDKVFYGRPDDSEKNRYLDWLYQTETGKKPINDLRELLSEAMKYANNKNVSQKVANKDVDFYELSIISELVKKYPEISALVGDVDFTPNSFGITGDKITYGKMFFSSASENEVKEFDRTVLSVLLYYYIKDNRYEKIIEQQAGKTKLSRETFNKLRNFILANFNTPEKEELLLYYLVINDLGKSQKMIDLLRERGIETVDHDMVLRYLLEYEMLPSLSRFSEESRQSLINILDNGINIGQVIQGECVDYSFACLNNLSDEDKILMLGEAILDIGGILGHINNQNGSVNLNEGIVEDFLILTNIMSKSVDPRRMGGKYLTDKACNMQVAAPNFNVATAITRICLMMDLRDKNDIRVVEKEINGHVDYYASLIDELNVSGYDNVPAILLYYAPALLNNACSYFKRKVVENPIKEALRSCLPFMQRIINDVRDKMVNNGNGVITVMLRDAAILAAEDPSQLESFTINILGDNEVVVKKQLTI